MKISDTKISSVKIIEPDVFYDERGFFMETWNYKKFKDMGLDVNFVQDNHSRSVKNTLRGLHYQIENTQGKLMKVIFGEVFDVAVDLRRSSPTFGKWVADILSSENKHMLWIPPGFAHGFFVMSEFAEIQYKCSDFYNNKAERCLNWADTTIGIAWPLSDGQLPVLSEKDQNAPMFSDIETFP